MTEQPTIAANYKTRPTPINRVQDLQIDLE